MFVLMVRLPWSASSTWPTPNAWPYSCVMTASRPYALVQAPETHHSKSVLMSTSAWTMLPLGPVVYVQVAARIPTPRMFPNPVTFWGPGFGTHAGRVVTSVRWFVLPR